MNECPKLEGARRALSVLDWVKYSSLYSASYHPNAKKLSTFDHQHHA